MPSYLNRLNENDFTQRSPFASQRSRPLTEKNHDKILCQTAAVKARTLSPFHHVKTASITIQKVQGPGDSQES